MKRIMLIVGVLLLAAIVLSACSFPSQDSADVSESNSAESSTDNGEESVSSESATSEEANTNGENSDANAESEAEDSGSESDVVEPAESELLPDFDAGKMETQLSKYVIRDEDLPHKYRLPPDGEFVLSTKVIINEMGELQAKKYVLATGRVNGWGIRLEREHKEDFAPLDIESRIELFESSDGAKLALSPEWYPAYKGDSGVTWVDGGCAIGDECLIYFSEKHDAASQITTTRYEVAFVYRNVLVWVMGRGLDVDVTPEYILDAAQKIYEKLDFYAQTQ